MAGATDQKMVVDPLCPIADTLIASEVLGSQCYALISSPTAIDAAIQRWQTCTGEQATHDQTGQPFNAGGV